MSITRRNTRLGAQPITQPITRGITLPITGESGEVPYTHTPNGYSWCGAYDGTGAAQSITGLGFQPDVVIITAASNIPTFFNSALGPGVYQRQANVNVVDAQSITSFDADGFSLGTSTVVNTAARRYVFIAIKAVAGFASVLDYVGTGAAHTEAHGLGATPNFIGVKPSSGAGTYVWGIYNSVDGATVGTNWSVLSYSVNASFWNDTAPDGTNFTVNTSIRTNENLNQYYGFALADVAGVFKLGSYTGNGSASGPVITGLGFRPAGVIVMRTGLSINNFARPALYEFDGTGTNVDTVGALGASGANITDVMDFDSDGFTIKTTNGEINANAATYLYLAFAA